MLSACNTTKNIPDNDALYTGASVKITDTDVPAKQKKAITSSLHGLVRPKPNTKVLGMPIKLWIYNMGSEKGIGKWLRGKFGEPPVLVSSVNVTRNVEVLDNHMENRGFFHVKVSGDTTIKGKKGSAAYQVATGPEYKISNITFPDDSSELSNAIRETAAKTLLKKGEPFNLDLIKGERVRIDVELKEKGFYYFNADYLVIQTDSTIGNNLVNMFLEVKPITPPEARRTYRINDVVIYSNYNLNSSRADTSMASAVYYKGYYVIDSAKQFKPKVFEQTMQFQSGDLYSRKDHNTTLSRLINLNVYKFVKNRFETVNDSNQLKLNTFYYLTPLPKKSLRAEFTGTNKSNNLTGSQVTLGWRNRNTFRGAEQLYVNVFGGSEIAVSSSFGRYNTFRVGGEATLSIPRFVIPFLDVRNPGQFVPKTNLQVGYELLNRSKLYTLTSIRGNYGYSWKKDLRTEHQLNPVSINYVQPLNVTPLYQKEMAANPSLSRIIEQQFIIGSTYNFNYNELAAGNTSRTGVYFNGLLDLSGNLAGLLTGANAAAGKPKELFGARFAQYFKTELDARYYKQIGLKSQWANRVILGFGLPYGNSTEIPFIKQFFVGGNNSLRGFRSRTVGPGSYTPPSLTSTNTTFIPDQSGDLKLELNTEFRPRFTSIIEGALFVDAGNIWLYNENPLKPGSKFTKDFLKQLAVDAGAGVRLDLTILLLRIDLAVPLKYPYTNATPDKGIIFNLAIGYPF